MRPSTFLAAAVGAVLALVAFDGRAQVNPVYRQVQSGPHAGDATQQQQITVPSGFGITLQSGAQLVCQPGSICPAGGVPLSSPACTGSLTTPDTAILNTWLQGLNTTGAAGILPVGVCTFDAALTPAAFGNITVVGQGPGLSILRYVGASATPGDLVTLGASSTRNIHLSGFTIDSATHLTAGTALKITGTEDVSLNINLGVESTYNLFNGLWLHNVTMANLGNSRFDAWSTGVLIDGSLEVRFNNAFVRGKVVQPTGNTHSNTTIDGLPDTSVLIVGMSVYDDAVGTGGIPRGTTIVSIDTPTSITISHPATHTASVTFTMAGYGTGILIGGGTGGVYFQGAGQLFNNIGVIIDTSLNAAGNTQIFGGDAVFDSNTQWAWIVNDAVSNPVSKEIAWGNAWATSSNIGGGLGVVAWAGGSIGIPGGVFTNNAGPGASFDDATSVVTIGSGAQVYRNGTFGITAANPITIATTNAPYTNTSGAYGPNVTTLAALPATTATSLNVTGASTVTGSSAAGGHMFFTDTAGGGATWQAGPGAGTGGTGDWGLFNQGTSKLVARFTSTGLTVLNGFAIASLPAGPPTGSLAYVTDQNGACPALGGTFTAGGTTKCRAWYNGTAWVQD